MKKMKKEPKCPSSLNCSLIVYELFSTVTLEACRNSADGETSGRIACSTFANRKMN